MGPHPHSLFTGPTGCRCTEVWWTRNSQEIPQLVNSWEGTLPYMFTHTGPTRGLKQGRRVSPDRSLPVYTGHRLGYPTGVKVTR